MAILLKQSSTAVPLQVLMVSAIDGTTPLTGLSPLPTIVISKNGASFASPAGTVAEVGSGWYQAAGNATDTNTLGTLIVHATAATASAYDEKYIVVAFDPQAVANLGLTDLDATMSSRLAATADPTSALSALATAVAATATPAQVATALANAGLTLARMRMLDAMASNWVVSGNPADTITMTTSDNHTLVWRFSPNIANPTSCTATLT